MGGDARRSGVPPAPALPRPCRHPAGRASSGCPARPSTTAAAARAAASLALRRIERQDGLRPIDRRATGETPAKATGAGVCRARHRLPRSARLGLPGPARPARRAFPPPHAAAPGQPAGAAAWSGACPAVACLVRSRAGWGGEPKHHIRENAQPAHDVTRTWSIFAPKRLAARRRQRCCCGRCGLLLKASRRRRGSWTVTAP